MTLVQETMPDIAEEAAQIAVVGSASALLAPCIDGANYILGHIQTGVIHHSCWPAGAEGNGRVYTWRHPDCEFLACFVKIDSQKGTSSFEITAGSGVTQTIYPPDNTIAQYWLAVPWDSGDSGWQTVEYESVDCDIEAISLWGFRRTTIDPTVEPGCEPADPHHAMAGLQEGLYIIHDGHQHNLDGLAAAILAGSKYNLRHAVTWCAIEGSLDVTPGAGVWENPLPFTFKHKARHLKSADTYRWYRVQARTWQVGAGTYRWRVVSGLNTTTTAGLAGTSAAKDEEIKTNLEIDCTGDDDLEFEMCPSAAQTLHVSDLSIVEYHDQSTPAPDPPAPNLIYSYYGDDIGDDTAADRLNWAPLDDISGSIVLDWADGDGTTPDVGPGLTKVGTVTAGKATQWRLEDHTAITCSEFADASCYYAAAGSMDPDDSDDVVLVALFRSHLIDYRQIFALRRTAPTVDGYWCSTSATYSLAWVEAAGGLVQGDILTSSYDNGCWVLLSVTKNRSTGWSYIYVNGSLADSADNDTASWGTNLIPVIGALDSSATNPINGDIARVVVAHGNGIAATCDATWHASLAEHVFGLLPDLGTAGTTYARTTSAIYYPTGDPDVRVHLISANCPPCGNEEGYGPDEQIVSFAEKNYAYVAGDDATYGGFDFHEIPDASWGENHTNTDTISDDSSDLATHGLRECGPNALHFELWIEIFGID